MASGYRFPILNSDGTASSTTVDFDDMFVSKEQFLDAGLYAVGLNDTGQLGNGNRTNYSSPIQVGALTNWKQVAAPPQSTHYLAVKTDGSLWAWGANPAGQLGNNNITAYSSPIQVGALYNWNQVSAGFRVSGAIKSGGTLWSWGANQWGQLGINASGATSYYSSPVQVGALTNWKQVAVGHINMAAIQTNGTLWAWGSNAYGQLGQGYSGNYYSSPIQVGALTNWKQVALGGSILGGNNRGFTLAITTNNALWAWGINDFGQLGNGNTTSYSSPVQVGTLTNWKQVSCSEYNTVAVKTDGTLWAWGDNSLGQLGNNNRTDYSSPVQVGTLTNWKQVSAGRLHTSAIKTDGTLWAWGVNNNGQLGIGNRTYHSSPVQVGALTNWKQVAASSNVVIAISSPDLP